MGFVFNIVEDITRHIIIACRKNKIIIPFISFLSFIEMFTY